MFDPISFPTLIQTALELDAPGFLQQVQENTYRLQDRTGQVFFVKVILPGDSLGQNELRANQQALAHSTLPTPRLLRVVHTPQAEIACWEWLEGEDLRLRGRERLSQAFARLGEFHASQRFVGPLTCPLDGRVYASLPALLDAIASYAPPDLREACVVRLCLLEAGYPTFIHGDMHPGNLRWQPGEGGEPAALYFVDWGFACPSLNLFDLDYIHSVTLDPPEEVDTWWNITPAEARDVLPAYFAACGLGNLNPWEIQRSVMLWALLRSHYNASQNDDAPAAELAHRRIENLLREAPI